MLKKYDNRFRNGDASKTLIFYMINRTEEEIMKTWDIVLGTTPVVSIVCMAYNHEKYLAQFK